MKKLPTKASGIHNLKTLGSMSRRSTPLSTKSAFLELYMRNNEKERLLNEKERLGKAEKQIKTRLADIDKKMSALLKVAAETAQNLKNPEAAEPKKKRTVLEY